MLTHFYRSDCFMEQVRASPGGSYLEEFSQALWNAGYAEITARRHLRAAQHFLHWAHDHHVPLEQLDERQIEHFRRHLPQCRCKQFGSSEHFLLGGARVFLSHLRCTGLVPPLASCDMNPRVPALLRAFCAWLKSNRNIAEVTLSHHFRVIRGFLKKVGEDPRKFAAQSIRRFFLARSHTCGVATMQGIATSLRAFTRFLIAEGLCSEGLIGAIPRLAHWHLTTLPRYLQPEEVEKVIAACSQETPVGLRDRAIVLLLARLALRAGDIVGMRLDDIDWQDGWVRVSGKGRRETKLPLPKEVGKAIFAYVTKSRPSVNTDILFIRSRAPERGFASHAAVSVIVSQAMRKAGIVSQARGAAHVLRHSAATAMLRQGATLQEIGIVLRHRCLETTSIYAKVDVLSLREIAQPWPEVDIC